VEDRVAGASGCGRQGEIRGGGGGGEERRGAHEGEKGGSSGDEEEDGSRLKKSRRRRRCERERENLLPSPLISRFDFRAVQNLRIRAHQFFQRKNNY
jgi:hypothetical protein